MSEFDLRYISLGAGVQSSCMYLMAVEGVLTPKPDCAFFADTQAEPPWVYEQLGRLASAGHHQIPIITTTSGNLGEAIRRAINGEAGRFASIPFWVSGKDGQPAPARRQCTREYKIDAIKKAVRERLGLRPGQVAAGRFKVEEWIGISMDEACRAKPSRYSWIETRWPLLFDRPMRRSDCLHWMKERGYPQPQKSACIFCPYSVNPQWRNFRDNHPNLWSFVCQIDRDLRDAGTLKGMEGKQFIHRTLVPLAEALIDEGPDDQLDLFQNECEGMCGV